MNNIINLYDLMDAAYDAPIIRSTASRWGVYRYRHKRPRNTKLEEQLRAEARRFELFILKDLLKTEQPQSTKEVEYG